MRPGAVRLTVLGVIVVTAIAAQAAAQALYRWVDEDGVVHYSQFPPPAPVTPLPPPPGVKPPSPPEAKPPSPPGGKASPPPVTKPAPAPEAKPSPPPATKPSPAPEAKPSEPREAKPSPAATLSPAHERAIRELVHVAAGAGVTDAVFQQIAQALVPDLEPALARQLQRPVSAAEERKLVDVIRRTFAGVFPTALLEDELVSVYAKHFSEGEADAKELLRFSQTPIGAKAIRVAAVLTGEGAGIGQRLAQSRQAEFAQRLRDDLAREFSP